MVVGRDTIDEAQRKADAFVQSIMPDADKLAEVVGWLKQGMADDDVPAEVEPLSVRTLSIVRKKLSRWLELFNTQPQGDTATTTT